MRCFQARKSAACGVSVREGFEMVLVHPARHSWMKWRGLRRACRNRGDIYKAKYEGYYCVDCEEYKDESEVRARGR